MNKLVFTTTPLSTNKNSLALFCSPYIRTPIYIAPCLDLHSFDESYDVNKYHYILEYTYEWFKNGDPTDLVSSQEDSNVFISGRGALYIISTNSSYAATYQCRVNIVGVGQIRTSRLYNLVVDTSHSKFILLD